MGQDEKSSEHLFNKIKEFPSLSGNSSSNYGECNTTPGSYVFLRCHHQAERTHRVHSTESLWEGSHTQLRAAAL